MIATLAAWTQITMIELIEVSQQFAGTQALDRLSLRVAPGQTTVLIGPSGCGKSTVLRLVAGLLTPTAGEVRVASELLRADNLLALRRRMGYVIQEGGLFPHLKVERNVSLIARRLGWSQDSITQRIDALCALTHFPADLLTRYPAELSGGQRQRVSLMRALMLDPDILLFDEPLGALDPMVRFEVQQELKSVFETLQKTVLLVTHDISEAALLGQTLVLMRQGRIVQQGSLQRLAEAPSEPFVTQFIAAQREPMEQVVRMLQ